MGRRSRLLGGYVLRNGIFVPSLVKSVQRGTITLTPGNLTGTATITAVNPSNCDLVYLGEGHDASEANNSRRRSYLTFTNSTTITATRGDSGGAGTETVGFEVIEYHYGVIKSAQRGTVTSTVTISAVNTAKARLSILGWSTTQTDGDAGASVTLTNSTTVTLNGNGASLTAGYQVLEFW